MNPDRGRPLYIAAHNTPPHLYQIGAEYHFVGWESEDQQTRDQWNAAWDSRSDWDHFGVQATTA